MRALLALALLAAAPLHAQDTAEDWPKSLWDPADPVPGQIDLPLPCGGRMAFVPVETPVEPDDPLADREVKLGGADRQTGYLDYYRTTYLRGGFDRDGTSLYYLAKYELTRDQHDVIAGDFCGKPPTDCPKPSRGGSRPQGGVSWFAAVDLSRRLSECVRTVFPGAMPEQDGVPGYVRLPTEAEWEYAARGGAKFDDADFRAPLPPMDGPLGDYAWFQGRSSANGAYRPIGTKKPNPLGLDGMFGGVEELMLEPFHLNRFGRPHGQPGGVVTRGGSIETPEAELSSALRYEWPYFTREGGAATAFETFGLRMTISAPVNTSLARTNEIRDRWLAGATPEKGDPLSVLDALIGRQSDQRLVEELSFVRGEFLSDRRARDEATARTARLTLLNGAVLINWMRQERESITRKEAVIPVAQAAIDDPSTAENVRESYRRNLPRLEAELETAKRNFDIAGSAYLTALIGLQETETPDSLRDAASQLVLELKEREQASLAPNIDEVVRGVAARRENPALSREALLDMALD